MGVSVDNQKTLMCIITEKLPFHGSSTLSDKIESVLALLTLGVHAQRYGIWSVCVSVCLPVCRSATSFSVTVVQHGQIAIV